MYREVDMWIDSHILYRWLDRAAIGVATITHVEIDLLRLAGYPISPRALKGLCFDIILVNWRVFQATY